MNYCGLDSDYLLDAEKIFSYDPDIPFCYRLLAKVIGEYKYEKAKELIHANNIDFSDKYSYLILDSAVEQCQMEKIGHVMKPTKESYDFIKWLLDNGANPHLPENFNQMEHLEDIENDGSQQTGCGFDCSLLRELLTRYM